MTVSSDALELPPMVKDALLLELDGRSAEALDRYRSALSTESTLAQDEALNQPLTVYVLSKAAHLSIDLGYGEEAWDLGGRLLSAKSRGAVEAGTLVRVRLLRLQDRTKEAIAAFDAFAKAWPGPSSSALTAEASRLRGTVKAAPWLGKAEWSWLMGPTEAFGVQILESARLQLGVFKDWGNALTLLDMLREKGWSPFTEVKVGPEGEKLHVVYLVSRQPASDRARLEAQGLLP